MTINVVHVDAFTEVPFRGNPAAVCLLEEPRSDAWLQSVASELNLPATAFVSADGAAFGLRWFSPTSELALCGHGTLSAAHVLWDAKTIPGLLAVPDQFTVPADKEVAFDTKCGRLSARRNNAWIEIDLPARPSSETEIPTGLSEALGVVPFCVEKSALDYLVEMESESEVRGLHPDFGLLSRIGSRGFIVTSRSDSAEFDFVSRFFAPSVGINEDPVTGSAHCCLGPYWGMKLGRLSLTGYQASKRGGFVRVTIRGDRVVLGGQALTVSRSLLTGAVANDV